MCNEATKSLKKPVRGLQWPDQLSGEPSFSPALSLFGIGLYDSFFLPFLFDTLSCGVLLFVWGKINGKCLIRLKRNEN